MVTVFSKALLVAAVLLGAAQPALAAGEQPPLKRPDGRGLGRVIAIGTSVFRVETPRGITRTLLVDERTTFEDRDGTPRSFSDLAIGMWVAGSYERNDQGRLVTRRVILVGEEPSRPDRRAAGEVTAVDPEDGAFSLHTRPGEDLTFSVAPDTVFRSPDGSVSGLSDLAPGMVAAVAARRQGDSLVALAVIAGVRPDRPARQHAAGEITAVRPATGSFSLRTREGADLTFAVMARTRLFSRDNSVDDLRELSAGMRAVVIYVEGADGILKALAVGVGDPQDLPRLDVRAVGRIVAVGPDTFTLATRSGERLTFTVGEDTVFRSRQGDVHGLDDLQPGLLVAVGARQVEEGELRALWVGVGPPARGNRTD